MGMIKFLYNIVMFKEDGGYMNEIKKEMKKVLGIAGALILVFLVTRYWGKLETAVSVAISAASPLILGCAMAYVINILMRFFEEWYDKLFRVNVARKVKRIVCLILAFVSLFGIVTLIVSLVLPELINCLAAFVRMIPGALQMLVGFVGEERLLQMFPELQNGIDFSNISSQVEQVIKMVLGGVGGAVDSIMTAVSSFASVVINVVIGLIFSLYVLLDKEGLKSRTKTLISTYFTKASDKIFYVIEVLDESFHSFIVGQCIDAVVLGALCAVGMWILRLPYAAMIGVFIGFTALIPIAGAYIGAAVGAIMILTVSPVQAIQFVVFIVVLQQLEGNLIYPRIVGKSIGLPGIWVLTAITIGGGVLGIGGMLLAVPLFAAGYRLIREDIARRTTIQMDETEEEKESVEESIFAEENEDV